VARFFYVFAGRRPVIPIQATPIKILGLATLFDHSVRQGPHNTLHHSQVLFVIVGLKKGRALEELVNDASDGPNVAGLTPAQLENDFGGAIVTGGHDRRMMLVIKSRGTEIYEPNATVPNLAN